MSAVANLVDLDRLVALRRHQELAGVVVVEAENVRSRNSIPKLVALE